MSMPDTTRTVTPAEDMTALGAVILAGTYQGSSAFGSTRPRPLLPIAQRPIIEYVLGWLRESGVSSATICANGSTGRMRAHLGDGGTFGVALSYHEDGIPRGAAGCVKDASQLNPAHTLVVTDGSSIPNGDLRKLLAQHRRTGASVTIAVLLVVEAVEVNRAPVYVTLASSSVTVNVPATYVMV